MKNKYGRKVIFEGHDEFGPVEIVEDPFFRSMHFGTDAPQCEMDLKDHFQLTLSCYKHMVMALLFKEHFESVLFLGLGGGVLPKFFWKYFPKLHIDVVERSSFVVELAKQYFDLPKDARVNVHTVDAFDFVQNSKSKYDLIFVDLFTKEGISNVSGKKSFFRACKELMKDPSSILVWNTWSLMPRELMISSVEHIAKYFGSNILILPDQFGNNVFIVFSQKLMFSPDQLRENAKMLQVKTGLDFPKLLKNLNDFKDCGFGR
jgi:spermidine synthase